MATAIYLAKIITSNGVIKKEGCFNQLGSIHTNTLCIQNLLDKQFPPIKNIRQWTILSGLFFGKGFIKAGKRHGGNLCMVWPMGVIQLPNKDILTIERLNMNDRRYKNCNIVNEYREFFNVRSINALIADNNVTSLTIKTYQAEHTDICNKMFFKAGVNLIF